jgi:hypothetical protein
MAPQTIYILQDFENHAKRNFPQAYKNISDANSYKFQSVVLAGSDIQFLHVAYWGFNPKGGAVWANTAPDGYSIRYYCETKEHGVIPTDDEPFPNEGRSCIQSPLAPFQFVKPRRWATAVKLVPSRKAARERFALFIKFVFLLTGRIECIVSDDGVDLLSEFEDMCIFIQNRKVEETETPGKEEGKSGQTSRGINSGTTYKTSAVGLSANVPASGSKRAAISSDDAYTKSKILRDK